MKIIHIAGGGDVGGAKPHIISLCARLSRSHEIKLVSLRSGDFADEAAAAGVNTAVIYSRLVPLDYLRLVSMVRAERPDIVHCHGAKANVAGVLVKLFSRIPIVTTIHSDWKLDYLHSFVRRNTIGRINAVALRFFDYFTTVSDRFKAMLIERGFDPFRAMPIYNGVDFSQKAKLENRAEYLREMGLNYEQGDVVVGIPVRLTPVKDIPTLLKAFAKASAQNPQLKLLIGGEGEQKESLTQMSRDLGLESRVSFCGWVSDVPKFFAACDIDVLCSISETFSYSVLEGVREDCAIIASDVGGMRTLIDHGENGFIFQPRDVDAFAEYLLELSLDETKRRNFAQKLRCKAERLYSLDAMESTQSEIYRSILTMEARKKTRHGVLICGAYGRGNSGDEAILKAIVSSMRALDPLMPVTVMTRRPKLTRARNQVRAVYTFNAPAFLRCMRKSKLFINGGGSLIQDSTSSRSLFFYLFTLFSAKRLGCKVLMYGCGIGHVARKFNRKLARAVINTSADIITLRDSISMDELAEMSITRPDARAAADPALSLEPASEREAREYLRAQGVDTQKPLICFSVREWKNFGGFDAFAKAADYASEKYGMGIVFLPIEHPKDVAPSRAVAAKMNANYTIIETPGDVNLTIALLKSMRIVCAMRLHALIFSAAAGATIIASSYDVKVSSFMEYIGLDACCELDALTAEWLCGQIDLAVQGHGVGVSVTERLRELERENTRAACELLTMP